MHTHGLCSFLFILFFFPFCLPAQQEIDSIKQLLTRSKEDTNKVNLLNLITEYCSEPEIRAYALPAIELANRLKYKPGLAQAYNNLSFYYHNAGLNDSAIFCTMKGIQINRDLKNYYQAGDGWNNLGYIYQQLGNRIASMNGFDSCMFYYKKSGRNEPVGNLLLNIGNTYEQEGNLKEALEKYYSALELFGKLKNKEGEATAYYCIGSLREKQGELDEAEKFCRMSLDLHRSLGGKEFIARGCQSLGILLMRKGKYEESLKLYKEGLKNSIDIGNTESMGAGYNNIGLYYIREENYNQALENFEKALKCAEKVNDKSALSSVHKNIGMCYLYTGDLKRANSFGKIGLGLAQEGGDVESIMHSAELLTKVNSKLNNFKEAFEMSELLGKMKDSLMNMENRKASFKKQINYEYELKEAAIKADKEKQELFHAEENKRNRMIIFFVVGGLLIAGIFAVLLYRRFRITRTQNRIIQVQKHRLEEKQKEIIDSINYARYIQKAMLKEEEHVSDHLPPHFILFKPKDIVSGDFYWALEKYNHLYFAAADCTGHGVPGAFLTLLGTSFLNDIAGKDDLIKPAAILDQLRDKIIKELSRAGKTKDGMDISLMRLNLKSNELIWAGANNPLWLVQKTADESDYTLKEIKADKQPVGFADDLKPFTNHVFNLKKGDILYLFTDGYADQFGGPKGKKFKYKQMEEVILQAVNKDMEDQKRNLDQRFLNWKGNLEQVDDVCVIGMKI